MKLVDDLASTFGLDRSDLNIVCGSIPVPTYPFNVTYYLSVLPLKALSAALG